jgi:hypothetical protein
MTAELSPWVLAKLPVPPPAEPRKKKSPLLTAIVPNATLNNLSNKKKQCEHGVAK